MQSDDPLSANLYSDHLHSGNMESRRQNFDGQHFGFFLVPGYSLVALSCAIDVLRAANLEIDRPFFSWTLIGEKNKTEGSQIVASSAGIETNYIDINDAPDFDVIAICGGRKTHLYSSQRAEKWLKSQARKSKKIGAISDGSYLAAKLGFFSECRSTIHWKCQSAYREINPWLDIRTSIFEVDGNRFSCAGGTASLDLWLYFISEKFGNKVAGRIADRYFHDVIRSDDQVQHMTSALRFAHRNQKLSKALVMMEEALEMPLPISEIAAHLGLSHRQLDRIFRKHLNMSPAQHYRDLRLLRAANLLKQTDLPIIDIAFGCGFHSSSHLAKFFKEHYGMTPSRYRQTNN